MLRLTVSAFPLSYKKYNKLLFIESEFELAERGTRKATRTLKPTIVNTQINSYPIYGVTYRAETRVYQPLLSQESESIGKTFVIRKFY